MANKQFDRLDLSILKMLSENARKPFLEIARMTGVSGAAVHQRVQKLLGTGVITGFETRLNPQAIGYNTCAYVGLFLKDLADFESVIEHLKEVPEIVECHCTTGGYDLFIKVYARNNDHLLNLIRNDIQPLGVERTETVISFKVVFERKVGISRNNNN